MHFKLSVLLRQHLMLTLTIEIKEKAFFAFLSGGFPRFSQIAREVKWIVDIILTFKMSLWPFKCTVMIRVTSLSMDGRSVFLQAKEKADTRILKPVSLTGGATSYLLQPYLLPGGVGMAFYSCHFFFIERLSCSGLLRSNKSGCEVHRRCAGDEALYDSGFKNIIRTEVPALLLKRGREKKIQRQTSS